MTQKITPFLWFDGNAEEAVNFYVSLFKDAEAGTVTRYGDAGPGEPGSAIIATFKLFGQEFTALNGGPAFKFNEAVSFLIDCKDQAEVDYYWEKLTERGEESMCGWLKDKYGLSWQVIPGKLGKLMSDPDPEKANRVMQAMLQMRKIDEAELQRAYDQE